jgi:hypothetical protein
MAGELPCYKCGLNPRRSLNHSYCRECHNAEQQKYIARNLDKVKASRKASRLNNIEKYKSRDRATSRTIEGRYRLAKSQAKRREIEFALSFEEYAFLVRNNACHYCGSGLPETGSGLDRKDSAVGYLNTNSVPCCFTCNTMKNAFLTYEEMLLVWNHRKNKNGKKFAASGGI